MAHRTKPGLSLIGCGPVALVLSAGVSPLLYAAPDAPCVVAAKGDSVEVERDGARHTGKYLILESCGSVRVVAGTALVYLDRDSDRPSEPVEFREGQSIVLPPAVPSAPDSWWNRFTTAFARLVGSEEKTKPAVSRGLEDDAAAALPAGRILPLSVPLLVDLKDAGLPLGGRFTIALAGGTRTAVLELPRLGAVLEIPVSALRPGLDYLWTAEMEGTTLSRSFRVISRSEAEDVERQAPVSASNPGGRLERAMYLESQGLAFDAARVLRQLVGAGGP